MMAITRGLAAGVVLAGAAFGFASPASAAPLSGTYTATTTDGEGKSRTAQRFPWC